MTDASPDLMQSCFLVQGVLPASGPASGPAKLIPSIMRSGNDCMGITGDQYRIDIRNELELCCHTLL